MSGILLSLSMAIALPAAAADEVAWQAKVHPRVLEDADSGPVEFIVFLDEQADLAGIGGLHRKADRGAAVHEQLKAVADRTQPVLLQQLDALGAEYRPYWVANMIWVRGDAAALQAMAGSVKVRRIDANPTVRVAPPRAEPGNLPVQRGGGSIEWNLTQVGADLVWAQGHVGTGVVIGGQDTGYDWDHPALIDQYRGWDGNTADHDYNWHDSIHQGLGDCGVDSPEPCDDHNHGSHTMGTMVGDDGSSNRIGMAPGAHWIGCRNMSEGNGTAITYSECFQWFIAPTDGAGLNPDPSKAPHVINNSWICPASEGCSFDTLATVVSNTRAAGIVVVVSAGNQGGGGCGTVSVAPTIYADSFSVGATDSGDAIAGFSSRGPVTVDGSNRLKPEISAPGVGVRSSIRNGAYGTLSGTSMAGPHVAGLVALLLGARPDLIGDVDTIEALIEQSALPLTSTEDCGTVPGTQIPNNTFGHGRIDAWALLNGDADGDGVANVDDCRPLDGAEWEAPSAVAGLVLSGGVQTTLSWGPHAGAGSSAPLYDVLRSESPDDFSATSCLVSDSALVPVDDADTPDDAFFYLVRAKSGCGITLGSASNGTPRSAPACP